LETGGPLSSPKRERLGVSFLLVTFLWTSKDKFIGNEFVLHSRPAGPITRTWSAKV